VLTLSVLDEHFAGAWKAMGDSHARERRRRHGLANDRTEIGGAEPA
jgi:hypothetical protein